MFTSLGNRDMYQVFVSDHGGLRAGPRFRLLADAERYVELHRHERSFAIRKPDGTWQRDEAGRVIAGRKRRTRASTWARGSQRFDVVDEAGVAPRAYEVKLAKEDPAAHGDETTNVEWPPEDGGPTLITG